MVSRLSIKVDDHRKKSTRGRVCDLWTIISLFASSILVVNFRATSLFHATTQLNITLFYIKYYSFELSIHGFWVTMNLLIVLTKIGQFFQMSKAEDSIYFKIWKRWEVQHRCNGIWISKRTSHTNKNIQLNSGAFIPHFEQMIGCLHKKRHSIKLQSIYVQIWTSIFIKYHNWKKFQDYHISFIFYNMIKYDNSIQPHWYYFSRDIFLLNDHQRTDDSLSL